MGLSAEATDRPSAASHVNQGLEGILRFDHVVVITEENESESPASAAPTEQQLAWMALKEKAAVSGFTLPRG